MKKWIITLISGALVTMSYAQEINHQNTLRLGLNRAFFGSGDIIGPALYVEYSRELNSFLAITPRIMSAYANRNDDNLISHASDFGTSVSLRITPFPYNGFRRIKVDIGGLYHRFIQSYGSVGSVDIYDTVIMSDSNYRKDDLFGFIGSVNISILDNDRFDLGGRLDLLTSLDEGYLNADSFQYGLFFGVKF
ncbi:MAG: hypothetical protein WBA23_04075 [Tunicatimonas sp.]|uniref:hypothetical protein n=1 Tax=Tunicatimonas sp. TaxID=1940096 RepID=UPI003C71949E